LMEHALNVGSVAHQPPAERGWRQD
jgi:hypothetical protein